MRHFQAYLADEARTAALGAALAGALAPGLVLYLHGDLGAGKTTLTRALLHACGHQGKVKSPTYTLAEPYAVMLGGCPVTVMHYDLYRLGGPEEFLEAGFREDFNNDNICIVEWPENAAGVLPPPDIDVFLDIKDAGREVKCKAMSEPGSLCLQRLRFDPQA